jgi:hypothetical protein
LIPHDGAFRESALAKRRTIDQNYAHGAVTIGKQILSNDTRIPMRAENVREGMELGPIFYVIGADQIESFARALSNRNPLFTSDSPMDAQLAPPTMRLNDYALLIAHHFRGGSGGVHAKHRAEFHEPARAGQTIKATGRIARTWRRRGKFYFELEYEMRDAESGTLLTRQSITSVLLRDGKMQ